MVAYRRNTLRNRSPIRMKPHVTCLMLSSVDGRLEPSHWSTSPDGDRKAWTKLYGEVQDDLGIDAWLIGRVTMAEMSKGRAKPVAIGPAPTRPVHVAPTTLNKFAIAFDTRGRVHFDEPVVEGNHAIVVLGPEVPDDHLRELAATGVSYVVAPAVPIDPAAALSTLAATFGIRRLALEGGGEINGAFFAAGLVDALDVLVAPALDGRGDARGIIEHGTVGLAAGARLRLTACEPKRSGVVLLRYAVDAA